MPDSLTPELNECTLAFDLDGHKFLFISANVSDVLGHPAADFYQNTNLLFESIDPHYQESVKTQHGELDAGATIELYYKIITPNGDLKGVYERKSLVVDQQSGHKILLSIIRDHLPEKLRLQDEAKLREKFLNSLIDSQTNFLIRFNPAGCFTFVNKQFLKVLGYKKSEIIGKHFSAVTIPEERELCEKAFYNGVHHPGKVTHLVHKKKAKDGTLFDMEWEFTAITNEDGFVTDIQGIGQNITDKISIEKKVKETALKLENFIESITDSFFIINKDWKFIKVNAAYEKVCNMSRDEMVARVIWELFPNLQATGFEHNFRMAAAENADVQFVEYFAPVNRWFNVSAYPSAEGLTVFARDITDSLRAEEEAIWTKNNLEALINNTEDQIWSLDKDTRYVYMNKAYRVQISRFTGVEPKEGDYSYLHPGYSEQVIEEWREYYSRALAGERYSIINESIDPATKKVLSFEISFNPIYKTKGHITGVGCFARNITPLLETEKAVIDQNERLRHIASLTSHELRRPVASMLGLLNLMDRSNFFNPDNKEIFEHLLTVGNEIDEVIRLIIDKTFMDDPLKNDYQTP